MRYFFNARYELEELITDGVGAIPIVRKQHPDDLLVLDEASHELVTKALRFGYVERKEQNDPTLQSLVSERVLVPEGGQKVKLVGPYVEHMHFWLQVTDTCNLTCDYCYIPSLNSQKTLNKDVLPMLGRQLCKVNGLKTVHLKLAGGEPLLVFKQWRDPIEELLKTLAVHNIELEIRLITNLTRLRDEVIEFIKRHSIIVSVSLDGLDEYHNQHRLYTNGLGSFDTVVQNFSRLRSAGIKPSVMITITSENHLGIPALVKYLIEQDIVFRISDAKGGYLKAVEFEQTMEKVNQIITAAVANGYALSRRVIFSDLRTHGPSATPCSMGSSAAAIYLDGSIYFCHTEFQKKQPIGHLDSEKNILDIILSAKSKHFGLSDDCKSCEYRLVCAGGCPLYRKNGKSSMCHVYKKILRQVFQLYEQEDSIHSN